MEDMKASHCSASSLYQRIKQNACQLHHLTPISQVSASKCVFVAAELVRPWVCITTPFQGSTRGLYLPLIRGFIRFKHRGNFHRHISP